MVNSTLSSRAAFTGPGGGAPGAKDAGREGRKEFRVPKVGAVCLTPPANPGPRATLTAESPNEARGMLAVRPAAETAVEGSLVEKLEGPCGCAARRVSVAAAREAADRSDLTLDLRFLDVDFGGGKEAVSAWGGNTDGLLWVASSARRAETRSCGTASPAVVSPCCCGLAV